MTPFRVAAVVLAAGSSSRLGRPKQLLEVDGQSLIRRTVQTVANSLAEVVIVTTADNGVSFEEELVGLRWTRAEVENPQLGQAESVKAGVAVVETQGGFDAILFTPCDLPLLSSSHLDALISTFQSAQWNIVASRYGEVLGAPLIVGRPLWPELHSLEGDTGVRRIIPAHLQATTSVEWPEGQFDLDTPDDVRAYQEKLGDSNS